MSGNEIINSLNPTYAYLSALRNINAKAYIVDAGGNGDFLSLEDAINAESQFIFIKNGEYSISNDVDLTFQNIIGETKNGVKITINDATINLKTTTEKTIGTSLNPAKLTDRSVLVTKGSGNNCNFNLVTSDGTTNIYLDSFLARVNSITDLNNLDLKIPFYGREGIDLYPWFLYNTPTQANKISNLTIKVVNTSLNDAIKIQGFNNIIENVNFYSENIYSNFITSSSDLPTIKLMIKNCFFEGAVKAISLDETFLSTIENCNFQISQDYDIYGTASTNFCKFKNNSSSGSKRGIRATGKGNKIINNSFEMIDEYAVYMGNAKDDIQWDIVTKNNFINCGNGTNPVVFIQTSMPKIIDNYFKGSDKCIVVDTNISSYGINISGNKFIECKNEINTDSTYNIIKGNTFKDSVTGSISITTNTYYNIISNNTFINCPSPINSLDRNQFSSNTIKYSSDTTITISNSNGSLNNNSFEKTKIIISGTLAIRNNKFKDISSGYALTISGDKCIIANNKFNSVTNGIDNQATADKSHILENIFHSITTNEINDNGTNTVNANNII